jgi:hypothetical protein
VTVEVLAVQPRLAVCCTGATPVPDTASAVGEFVALLVKDRLPELAPLACGVNVTVKVALWPAFNVIGKDKPLSLNSALFEEASEIVTPEPFAVIVAFWFELCPTVTLPKVTVVGVTLSCPGVDPEPESAMFRFVLPAVKAIFPLREPAD